MIVLFTSLRGWCLVLAVSVLMYGCAFVTGSIVATVIAQVNRGIQNAE